MIPKRPQSPIIPDLCSFACHLDTGQTCHLNSSSLCSSDWTLDRMNLLSVHEFGLLVSTAPGHGGGSVTVFSPLPTRSMLWGKSSLLASTKIRSLYHPLREGLFHGEYSMESLRFRMPNRLLALLVPCHMSDTCASCFSLVLTEAQGLYALWLCCSLSVSAARWQPPPTFPHSTAGEPEVQPGGGG